MFLQIVVVVNVVTAATFTRSLSTQGTRPVCSVEDARLVGGNHILDVDEGVFAPVDLEKFQGLLDEVSEHEALPLRVLDLVPLIAIAALEQVEDRQNLPVVGHESLAYGLVAGDESLQHLQGDADDLSVPRVQCGCRT